LLKTDCVTVAVGIVAVEARVDTDVGAVKDGVDTDVDVVKYRVDTDVVASAWLMLK
jgi:hypothetical protein